VTFSRDGEGQTSVNQCVQVKSILAMILCMILMGCAPSPGSKETHIKQVQRESATAGGETNILNQSRILFMRLSGETNVVVFPVRERNRWFEGLSGITNLGDVFYYEPFESDRIRVRIHNSHFDTYFIYLVNPDLPRPASFERIVGNVGFIESTAR